MRLQVYNEIVVDWKLENGEILGLAEDNTWVSLGDESDAELLAFLKNAREIV